MHEKISRGRAWDSFSSKEMRMVGYFEGRIFRSVVACSSLRPGHFHDLSIIMDWLSSLYRRLSTGRLRGIHSRHFCPMVAEGLDAVSLQASKRSSLGLHLFWWSRLWRLYGMLHLTFLGALPKNVDGAKKFRGVLQSVSFTVWWDLSFRRVQIMTLPIWLRSHFVIHRASQEQFWNALRAPRLSEFKMSDNAFKKAIRSQIFQIKKPSFWQKLQHVLHRWRNLPVV